MDPFDDDRLIFIDRNDSLSKNFRTIYEIKGRYINFLTVEKLIDLLIEKVNINSSNTFIIFFSIFL